MAASFTAMVFVIAMGVFLQLNIIGDKSDVTSESNPPDFAVEMALAEGLHAEFGDLDRAADPAKAEELRLRAIREYVLASKDTDTMRAARALIGAGQLTIAGSDTSGAAAFWERAVELRADSFQTLRAMKMIADLYFADGDDAAGRLWDDRIVAAFSDPGATQQTKVIVEQSRKR